MTYQGLPDFLRPHGNQWLTAGEIAKLIKLRGDDVKKVSSNPEAHSWVYKNRARIKFQSYGPGSNGLGEIRRYLVKSVWCVARADGLEVLPTYAIAPIEQKLQFLEERNAQLEQQLAQKSPEIRVVHAKREFSDSDALLLKLLVMASDPRPKPGVYFLVSDSCGITYVGQSKNVISRMVGHQSKAYDFARMIEIPDDAQRLEIEMRLIKLLEPRDNLMGLARAA
jgi:hypothetical protein